MPEGRLIFPDLSVLENIRVGERKPAKVWTVDRLLQLFPSLRERAGNRGWQLSGGEQQMLAIARALVSDPRVVLLDEPSQGLAPLVVRELAGVIRQLCAEGVTILLIEQNMKLAEAVADELHIMVKGRIVYGAAPEVFRAEEAGNPHPLPDGLIAVCAQVDWRPPGLAGRPRTGSKRMPGGLRRILFVKPIWIIYQMDLTSVRTQNLISSIIIAGCFARQTVWCRWWQNQQVQPPATQNKIVFDINQPNINSWPDRLGDSVSVRDNLFRNSQPPP